MTIHVTQDDINKGIRCYPDYCPLHRALARHGIWVWVMGKFVFTSFSVETSQEVKNFINSFDKGFPVRPFSFNLSAECMMK